MTKKISMDDVVRLRALLHARKKAFAVSDMGNTGVVEDGIAMGSGEKDVPPTSKGHSTIPRYFLENTEKKISAKKKEKKMKQLPADGTLAQDENGVDSDREGGLDSIFHLLTQHLRILENDKREANAGIQRIMAQENGIDDSIADLKAKIKALTTELIQLRLKRKQETDTMTAIETRLDKARDLMVSLSDAASHGSEPDVTFCADWNVTGNCMALAKGVECMNGVHECALCVTKLGKDVNHQEVGHPALKCPALEKLPQEKGEHVRQSEALLAELESFQREDANGLQKVVNNKVEKDGETSVITSGPPIVPSHPTEHASPSLSTPFAKITESDGIEDVQSGFRYVRVKTSPHEELSSMQPPSRDHGFSDVSTIPRRISEQNDMLEGVRRESEDRRSMDRHDDDHNRNGKRQRSASPRPRSRLGTHDSSSHPVYFRPEHSPAYARQGVPPANAPYPSIQHDPRYEDYSHVPPRPMPGNAIHPRMYEQNVRQYSDSMQYSDAHASHNPNLIPVAAHARPMQRTEVGSNVEPRAHFETRHPFAHPSAYYHDTPFQRDHQMSAYPPPSLHASQIQGIVQSVLSRPPLPPQATMPFAYGVNTPMSSMPFKPPLHGDPRHHHPMVAQQQAPISLPRLYSPALPATHNNPYPHHQMRPPGHHLLQQERPHHPPQRPYPPEYQHPHHMPPASFHPESSREPPSQHRTSR